MTTSTQTPHTTHWNKKPETIWIDLMPWVQVNAPNRPMNTDDVTDLLQALIHIQCLVKDWTLKQAPSSDEEGVFVFVHA